MLATQRPSDNGARIVRAVVETGLEVVPVSGASARLAALVAAPGGVLPPALDAVGEASS